MSEILGKQVSESSVCRGGEADELVEPARDLISSLVPFLGPRPLCSPLSAPGRSLLETLVPVMACQMDQSALQRLMDESFGELCQLCAGVVSLCSSLIGFITPSMGQQLMQLGNLLEGRPTCIYMIVLHGPQTCTW